MNIFKLLFSFKGTISRLKYVLGAVIASVVGIIVFALIYILIGDHHLSDSMKVTKAALYLSCLIFMIITHFALSSKRLRDLQWGQWLLLLTVIPIVSSIMLILFICIPGKTGNTHNFQSRPWARFFARHLDLLFTGLLVGTAIRFIDPTFFLNILASLGLWTIFVVGVVLLFLYVFIESFFFAAFGTTFGKWMLNVYVRDMNGFKLGFFNALKRGLKVWWFGLGMGLPIIYLITYTKSYTKLTDKAATTWDENKFLVTHGKIRISKIIAGFLIIIAVLALRVVVDSYKTISPADEIALTNEYLHLPKLIDKETEFTSVSLENNYMNYNYRLINIKIGDINIDAFEKGMHKILLQKFCGEKKLIANRYPILFCNYNDKNGNRLVTIPVNFEDCQS